MSLTRNLFNFYRRQVLTYKTATGDIELYENPVIASGEITLTLPPVAEAKGLHFAIHAPTGNDDNVTIAHHSDSYDWSNVVLNAANDGALCYSDGRKWWVTAD